MNFRESFAEYINAENREGSNKASSYIRALNLLAQIMRRSPLFDVSDFWATASVDKISALYEYALEFQKNEDSIFLQTDFPPSYGRNGYYSAALKSYIEFLVIHQYEQQLWDIYQDPKVEPEKLAKKLVATKVKSVELLVEEKDLDFKSREGKDAIREVKARIGQGFFRKMILNQYNTQCCVTGLNVPVVLRASHITGWAEDPDNRMNPCNGLCLSATYDAAFDRHLISFDDDYRLIISPALKDYFTNKAFQEQFKALEGQALGLPKRWRPDQVLLERHRSRMF